MRAPSRPLGTGDRRLLMQPLCCGREVPALRSRLLTDDGQWWRAPPRLRAVIHSTKRDHPPDIWLLRRGSKPRSGAGPLAGRRSSSGSACQRREWCCGQVRRGAYAPRNRSRL
jgi:hypothetical protein